MSHSAAAGMALIARRVRFDLVHPLFFFLNHGKGIPFD
jgi:hypothetical protein